MAAGNFSLGSSTLNVPNGVTLQGAEGTWSRVRGKGVNPEPLTNFTTSAQQGVTGGENSTLRWFSISGATGDSGCIPGCGRGVTGGDNLRVEYVEMHDNLVQGSGGTGNGTVIYRSEYFGNGDAVATGINSGGAKSGNTLAVIESYSHDNTGNGFWCDNDCLGSHPSSAYGYAIPSDFTVLNSTTEDEGRNGIRWEHGNGVTSAEAAAASATIKGNVVVNSNISCNSPGGGIEVNSASNTDLMFNDLGGTNDAGSSGCSANGGPGVNIRGARHPLTNNDVTDNNTGANQGFSTPDSIIHNGTGTVTRNGQTAVGAAGFPLV
jgi:hypothetical protein